MSPLSAHIHSHQKHLFWDNSIPPVDTVSSGATIVFRCLDASNGQLGPKSTVEDLKWDKTQLDQVHGPVAITGAMPGDVLQIEIISVVPYAGWGWTSISPTFGFLGAELGSTIDLKIWHIEDGYASATFGSKTVKVPTSPFCGQMGVARGLKGAWKTLPPYSTGGNMDSRHLTAGTTLYLPIEVEGAMLSVGDGHAAQGDGEVCGSAIETPVECTLRVTVIKASDFVGGTVRQPQYRNTPKEAVPELESEGFYTTTGIDSDLREAAKKAVVHMIDYLHARTKGALSKTDAYILLSATGDVQVLELVDMPNYAVGMRLPWYIMSQLE